MGATLNSGTLTMTFLMTGVRTRTRALAISAATLCAGLIGQAAQAATNLYVSPTGPDTADCSSEAQACSLLHARDRVRTLNANMSGDIVVNLAAGNYALKSTFQLGWLDSGSNAFNVIYQGPANAATPAVLSGGTPVTGWTLHDSSKNIWKTTLPAGVEFRQLYVNGNRATRARWPNVVNPDTGEPYLRAVSTVSQVNGQDTLAFVVRNADLKVSSNLLGTEVVWLSHWMQKRARIASYTLNKPQSYQTTINFKSPEKSVETYRSFPQDPAPFFYENAYSLLDAPGEWFLDQQRNPRVLYYIPRPGEDMGQALVIAPQVQTLVEVAGSPLKTIHHIQLKNLSFKHSNWNTPSAIGYVDGQASVWVADGSVVPAAVVVKFADQVALENNVFSATGAHGLLLRDEVANYRVVHNQFSDLSAGGIYDEAYMSSNGLISGNLVEKVGRDYMDAIGILVMTPHDAAIQYNEIRQAPYSGISLGWVWGPAPTSYNNNLVQGNHIHHVMQALDDGAGIYTLGRMYNTAFKGNYIHDVSPSGAFGGTPVVGIFLDEGSSSRTISGNVLGNVQMTFKLNPGGGGNHENTFSGNYYNSTELGVASGGDNIVSGNIQVAPGQAWPADALTIIGNAGIR